MTKKQQQHDNPLDLRLPGQLVEDLNRLFDPPTEIPQTIHTLIADQAWHRCETIRTRRRIRRWGQVGAVAALVLFLVWFGDAPRRSSLSPAVTAAGIEDIDRDGRVNILDAFALAREIDRGTSLSRNWDVNRDGMVDRADVDEIAAAAVSLSGSNTGES